MAHNLLPESIIYNVICVDVYMYIFRSISLDRHEDDDNRSIHSYSVDSVPPLTMVVISITFLYISLLLCDSCNNSNLDSIESIPYVS